jgi:homoserine O-acetyltransferase/O-succinyltransferase
MTKSALLTSAPVSKETRLWRSNSPLELEGGDALPDVQVAYRTWGRLDADRGNAVLVCHALTGSADADVWWGGLFGPGRALDPARDFIVCSNVLAGCYGSSGPIQPHPEDGEPWGSRFPVVTVRDMVRLQARLLDALGVGPLKLVLGPSLGGMQVLEWAASYPERVKARWRRSGSPGATRPGASASAKASARRSTSTPPGTTGAIPWTGRRATAWRWRA